MDQADPDRERPLEQGAGIGAGRGLADLTRRESKRYQPFDRVLTLDGERLLCASWSQALGVPVEGNHIRYLQHRIGVIEDSCLGRLAGSVQDAILRVLVAFSIRGDSLRFLEIGTLFGNSALVMYDLTACSFERVNLTTIDPLDGYCGSGKVDIVTGLPATRSVLQRNLDRVLIPCEDYTIIAGYSAASAALRSTARTRYNLVFVDGDHTYEVVKADFEYNSPMLERSGYLILDEYGTEAWPGVQRFVDEVVPQSPDYEPISASW